MKIESFTHQGYTLALYSRPGRRYHLYAENKNVKPRIRRYWTLATSDLDRAKDAFYREKFRLRKIGRIDRVFESSLEDWIDRFLRWSKTYARPRTHEIRALAMKDFRACIESEKLTRLDLPAYARFRDFLKTKGNSSRTVDIKLTAISTMIRMLEEEGVVTVGSIPRPKQIREKSARRPQFWEDEEVRKILDVAEGRYIRDMVELGLHTGLRRTELIHLRWSDVKDGYLDVRKYDEQYMGVVYSFDAKDHEARRIRLNASARAVLDRLRTNEPYTPWVFANKYGRPRLDTARLNRDLGEVLTKAGVRNKGLWHAIRRTFAAHLIMAGADLESLRQLLGHSEIGTTQRYLNITAKHLDKTVDLLSFSADKTADK